MAMEYHALTCHVKGAVFHQRHHGSFLIQRFGFSAQVRSSPTEGVYIHGLFLDGAAWSKQEGFMVESEPKKLFVSLPVLYVSANTKNDQVCPNPVEDGP